MRGWRIRTNAAGIQATMATDGRIRKNYPQAIQDETGTAPADHPVRVIHCNVVDEQSRTTGKAADDRIHDQRGNEQVETVQEHREL